MSHDEELRVLTDTVRVHKVTSDRRAAAAALARRPLDERVADEMRELLGSDPETQASLSRLRLVEYQPDDTEAGDEQ